MKINPEFLPLIEWWEKDGKQVVTYLAVAAIAVGGWYGWKAHRAAVRQAAGNALVNAYTTEEMEEAVTKFSSTATSGALKLRLAKNYYDNARYEEALSVYESLLAKAPEGFEDIPVVGKAQCLEALGKFDEALKAYDDFAAANPKSYLATTAKLGAARVLVQSDKRKDALARIETLKSECKDDEISKARVEATEAAINRYQKPVEKPVEATKPVEAK